LVTTTGYAKIERGETKLQNPKLEKILKALEINLKDLLDFDNQNIFKTSFNDKCSNTFQNVIYINSAIELTQELEKLKVKFEAKEIENHLLKEQVNQLKEILTLMKKEIP
jgi:transcriptional regulator with XRE-family HTH domain